VVSADSVGRPGGSSADIELRVVLRRLRRGRGLSQRDLLRPLRLGSHSAIVDWEAGRRIPPADMLVAYERYFGLVPGQLLTLRDRALAERAAAEARSLLDLAGTAAGADAGTAGQAETAAGQVGAVPRYLPAAAAPFVGRAAALAELDRILREHSASATVVISAIGGMAGIGKTALAVHFARCAATRFPDGQLYVNLRGFGPPERPVTAAEAIRGFLDALRVPAARIPPDLDAQAGLYRSVLAGRRVLVVLDNARDAGQVRPLLPGAPGCLVLVTSRSLLSGLVASDGAHLIDLDLLTPAECRDLLAARLGPHRVAVEPQAVAQITAACGRLPLALAILAARAAARPGFPLRALAAELRSGPLDALAADSDPATDVRTVFSWSYRALSPAAARLFRLLSLPSGASISAPAAASLAGLPMLETRPLLTELTAAHLICEQAPGRYACHDLLRAYARQLARDEDCDRQRDAAIGRVLDHYLHTAHAADRLLDPSRDVITLGPARPGVSPQQHADRRRSLAWFTAEHAVLLAAVDDAAAAGSDACAWQLAWTLWPFLDRRGHWHDQAATGRAALAAARRLADPQAQARAHRLLATAYLALDRCDDARTHLTHALELCRQAGEAAGQGRAEHGLALVCGKQDRHVQALGHARRAVELYRAAGHQRGQARALNSAGWSHVQLGDYQQALIAAQHALALHTELGDQHGLAHTWDTLGCARHHLGQYGQATDCYQRALSIYRELDDQYYEAGTLGRLGDTRQAAGDPDAARDAWQRALAIFDDLSHPSAGQLRAKLAALDALARSYGGPEPESRA
jgi:tetratricopeptide (TPR) repeat protein/transcriptional regulator with XRE-family HTH domain